MTRADAPRPQRTDSAAQSARAIAKDLNQIVTWGNSAVLKVHNTAYQKVAGHFYHASNPGRKVRRDEKRPSITRTIPCGPL